MDMHLIENRAPYGYTSWGCIWEQGKITENNFIAKTKDTVLPLQSEILAYWPDHSVKWTSHCADAGILGSSFSVEPGTAELTEKLEVNESEQAYTVSGKNISVVIPKSGEVLLEKFRYKGNEQIKEAVSLLSLEERSIDGDAEIKRKVKLTGKIEQTVLEEKGPYKCTFCTRGVHESLSGRKAIPFVLRQTYYYNSPKADFTYTFLYDGDEKKDFISSIGVSFKRTMHSALYNRHIRFGTDAGSFHEALILLSSWRPRIPEEIYKAQNDGKFISFDEENDKSAIEASQKMPVWSRYSLLQDSSTHFVISKKIKNPECCYIEGLHGMRAPGSAAFGDEFGGLCIGVQDFWQKYPSELEVSDMDSDCAQAAVWFWSDKVQPCDFRHYADKGYSQTYYEGFDEVGASAYGIANTSDFSIEAYEGELPDEERLDRFSKAVSKPALYIGTPEYYNRLKAFGEWSLPSYDTPVEAYLEKQLDKAFEFYKNEIEVRKWYGRFNYGDIMHTYDKYRHCWKYDMGGYAWQNTELVPTLWLWLYFMRTGREDVYTAARAMTRHCSEVDVYHFGPLKGIGSRHNVRHWGCSCKEARIAMAGHHRFFYYLTGDRRIADVFDDVKDADFALLNKDPLRFFYDKDKMVYPTHARSGPDWSTFCSDWMTQWERFDDKVYRDKIKTGIEDIKKAPLKLTSGTDFEYDPVSGHLRYIGEKAAGGSHLQICMGAIQVWIELAELLGDDEFKEMLAAHGRFYYLPREKQLELSKGLIGKREFSLPFMASGLAAYASSYYNDKELARTTWTILLHALFTENNHEGFEIKPVENAGNQPVLNEIPWITTNFTSQWCLNIITALTYIKDELPKTMDELSQLLKGLTEEGFHKA